MLPWPTEPWPMLWTTMTPAPVLRGTRAFPFSPPFWLWAKSSALSGKEIITAYVLGIEAWSKISANMPALHFKGWHPTAVFGPIGTAAAAAKLLKLDAEQIIMALGLAGSQAAGLGQNFGTMTKPFHAGFSPGSENAFLQRAPKWAGRQVQHEFLPVGRSCGPQSRPGSGHG